MVAREYFYVAAWGQLMAFPRWHIEREQERAAIHKAPADVVFYSTGETRWVRIGEVVNQTNREWVEKIVAELRGAVPGGRGQ